jgi:hypothetical protein
MNARTSLLLFAPLTLSTLASAQFQEGLIAFSQNEQTLSGSGGTVLTALRPNETAVLAWGTSAGCLGLSAEKWAPRTTYHTMAGDENADGTYFNPALFGRIDALVTTVPATAPGYDNQRTVFWSVEAAMGNAISLNPFRPGDVARIVRGGPGDGQVQYFMRQEQFNQALGLPPATPIDVDAIAFSPQFGVFFSLDGDQWANTACGPVFVQDGAVVAIPPAALTYTVDMRIAGVLPNTAIVVLSEAQIDALVANAQVTDRFGNCVPNATDLESLEFAWGGTITTLFGCTAAMGVAVAAPDLLGRERHRRQPADHRRRRLDLERPVLADGAQLRHGPTLGLQAGIRPVSGNIGAASYVNAFTLAHANRYVLEPQNHVLPVFPAGAPAGSTTIDIGSPFAWNLVFMEIVPPTVPGSLPAFPFSQLFFPDLYTPSLFFYMPAAAPLGFGSFPMPAIPPLYTGKVLFQAVGFTAATIELSTPTVIDVQ